MAAYRGIIGIDLGTSNTVVALKLDARAQPEVFPIEQHVSATTKESRALLPSCLYAPIEGESGPQSWIPGVFARTRGVEVPARFVSSSKSWLCHHRVDRESAILPWGLDDEGPKLSPVEAARRILDHVLAALRANGVAVGDCDVVLTVPASFDDVARELTLRAANASGVGVRLLEEPQAALYVPVAAGARASLSAHLAAQNKSTGYVLVCDVGGGTTDLSLFRAERTASGAAGLERTAVGPHLLLGGDNMDLAIAHHVELALALDAPLSPGEFAGLVTSCQRAKEALFSGASDEVRVAVARRGSELVGRTKSTLLRAEDVSRLVLEGFFPIVPRIALSGGRRAGLVAMGLPFEREPAITRHVAAFLLRHLPEGESVVGLLLNGGVFRAEPIASRLRDVLTSWQADVPLSLSGHDPDTAVALGAVHYVRALRGEVARIEGGAPRSYFIAAGVDTSGKAKLVTIIPKGTREGDVQTIDALPLRLVVGRAARFDLHSSDITLGVKAGDVVAGDPEGFERLPPLTTTALASRGEKELPVTLRAALTPVGTLELSLIEIGGEGRTFQLAFELRAAEDAPASIAAPSRHIGRDLDQALVLVTNVFGKGTTSEAKDAKNVLKELTRLLGEKETWSLDISRALAERVVSHKKGRRRTLDHERVFFQLAGFTMRPGYGAPGDAERAKEIEPLFAEGLAFPKEARSWQQLLICYRRIAGGLGEPSQRALRDTLVPFVAPSELKLKKPKTWKPESSDYEILELLSHLERIPARERAEIGGFILERTWTKREPRFWAAIGRIGARIPTYAELNHVVAPNIVEKWIDHLLREKWSDLKTAPRAAAELARMTGDRSRDVSPSIRAEVVRRFERENVDATMARWVTEVVALAPDERGVFQGERLPPGLVL